MKEKIELILDEFDNFMGPNSQVTIMLDGKATDCFPILLARKYCSTVEDKDFVRNTYQDAYLLVFTDATIAPQCEYTNFAIADYNEIKKKQKTLFSKNNWSTEKNYTKTSLNQIPNQGYHFRGWVGL
jgi:hypothetical protein